MILKIKYNVKVQYYKKNIQSIKKCIDVKNKKKKKQLQYEHQNKNL